jgi:superoxide dismutase, Cu-Zn family
MTRLQLRLGVLVGCVVVSSIAVVAGCSDDPPAPGAPSGTSGSSSSGSSGASSSSGTSGTVSSPILKAKATIAPTVDAGPDAAPGLSGSAEFEESTLQDGGTWTKVTVKITGGTPGDHGLHIHENGSCDATDAGPALAAGGHWNPIDAGHSLPQSGSGHMGDLGNIYIGSDGTGTLPATSTVFYVKPGPYSVVGHAVIYHANPDNGLPPVGNAGPRPGCGVIVKQ